MKTKTHILIKKSLWLGLGIFLFPIIFFKIFVIYQHLIVSGSLHFTEFGNLILIFELLLASMVAFQEDGHFPLPYLIIFIISALVFYLAFNKTDMNETMIITYVVSIIVLSITYLKVNKSGSC